jgi:hypothetical protein
VSGFGFDEFSTQGDLAAHGLLADDGIPEGKMWADGELVDDSECCDGSDDGYYVCSFPPCVAQQEADAAYWLAQCAPLNSVADESLAYEPGDPKREDYLEHVWASA